MSDPIKAPVIAAPTVDDVFERIVHDETIESTTTGVPVVKSVKPPGVPGPVVLPSAVVTAKTPVVAAPVVEEPTTGVVAVKPALPEAPVLPEAPTVAELNDAHARAHAAAQHVNDILAAGGNLRHAEAHLRVIHQAIRKGARWRP